MKTEAYPTKRLTKQELKDLRKYLADADENVASVTSHLDNELQETLNNRESEPYELEDEEELPSNIDYKRLNNSDFSTEDE